MISGRRRRRRLGEHRSTPVGSGRLTAPGTVGQARRERRRPPRSLSRSGRCAPTTPDGYWCSPPTGVPAPCSTINPIKDYANNDYWYDDTADGPVTATVSPDRWSRASRSMAGLVHVRAAALRHGDHVHHDVVGPDGGGRRSRPTVRRCRSRHDIWPIFARVADYQWTNATALIGHGPAGPGGASHDPVVAARLADNRDENERSETGSSCASTIRALIPARADRPSCRAATRMPRAPSRPTATTCRRCAATTGSTARREADPTTWLAVIPSQYDRLRRWREGDFVDDWPGRASPGCRLRPRSTRSRPPNNPTALTRAALEHTIGAPFYPGIEMTYVVRHPALYSAPFRFADSLSAGDITRWMAMPWQADFFECNTFWWPSARPDDVVPASVYFAAVLAARGAPGYLLTADVSKELSATLPPRLATELVALVGVPLSSASELPGRSARSSARAFEKYGAFLLDRTRQTRLRRRPRCVGGPPPVGAGVGGPTGHPRW